MSLIIDLLLVVQSVFIFLFAGYEYRTLMHFPALPMASGNSSGIQLVSIILPVRNQVRTVQECVRSLIGAKYARKEILVVDGHSTDGTREILQSFRGQITVVEEEPLRPGWIGKNWACHLGYKRAKGDLLLFTDGDSIHGTDSLTRAVD